MERHVTFACGQLKLEGVLTLPDGGGPFPGVVVCHPHPLYGGSMDNNVVYAICHELDGRTMASFRFNFRGVGRSQGDYSDGIGEKDDIIAAFDYLTSVKGVDPDRMGLAGYSFGAGVCLFVAPKDQRVQALALVSPIPNPIGFDQIKRYTKPRLFVCGTADMYAAPEGLVPLVEALPEPKGLEVVSGADHFWMGHERTMASKVGAFLADALKPPSA
jgi:hypothetical protein